jgi:hypothetical protein
VTSPPPPRPSAGNARRRETDAPPGLGGAARGRWSFSGRLQHGRAQPVAGSQRELGGGVLSGFTGTFPAVLAFSAFLAALCLFSLARIATALTPDTAVSQ